jgi:hypothetical protein
MKAAVEHIFNGPTGSLSSYTSSLCSFGNLFQQYTGSKSYIAPNATLSVSLPEVSTFTTTYPHVYQWSNRYFWIFTADFATAASTRRVVMYQYDRQTDSTSLIGSILLNFSVISGNKTSRSIRGLVYKHTTGTVQATNATTITGTSTQFQTERIAAGARIGFGSTNPTEITTWYNITAIASDTSLIIDQTVTIPAGTSYVIEEIRIAYICTNATAANGGLFLVKGLNPSVFTANTSISEAASTDNLRAIYFLKDAVTNNNTVAYGIGMADEVSKTEHECYILNADATTTARIYRFNLRAALTVSSGASTSAFVYRTGQATTTGTIATAHNGRVFAVNHGAASGISSFWFCTTTRVYRCALTDITNGGTSHLTDAMVEIPAGSTTTYPATATLSQVDYASSIDRLIISTGVAPFRLHITDYKTDGSQFEKYIIPDLGRLESSTTSTDVANTISARALPHNIWTEDGILFTIPASVTTGINIMYVYPGFGADWSYADTAQQYIITPKLTTLNAQKLYRAYVTNKENEGNEHLGSATDGFRLYARTSGIDDNTGGWILLNDDFGLTGLTPGTHIQFKIEFETLSDLCVPTKIYSVCCVYEDGSQDYHYEPSLTYSSAQNRIFAWRQAQSWGSNIPNLRIRLFNIATGLLIHDDDITNSDYGTWQYSTDGITWNTWSAAQDVVGNYIRYTATSLPNNITVRALLTQGV